MANKYNGYIYDVCSWGVIVAWKTEEHYGEHEEFYYNDYFNRQELFDILDNNFIADSYTDYIEGEIKEYC